MRHTKQTARLKDSTIFSALSILSSLGRIKSVDFAYSYWPGKYEIGVDGVAASLAGRNLLFKLKKYGYVTAFKRTGGDSNFSGVYVFEVSSSGFEFMGLQNR